MSEENGAQINDKFDVSKPIKEVKINGVNNVEIKIIIAKINELVRKVNSKLYTDISPTSVPEKSPEKKKGIFKKFF